MGRSIKIEILCLGLCLGLSTIGRADDSSSAELQAPIEDVSGQANKSGGSDVDDLLTNNLMRAQSGSKSKYSIATSFSYNGGSVDEPLGQSRPDITAANGMTAVAQLVGDISGKYNFDQMHSLLLGVGIRWITPLYGTSAPTGYDKLDADNPYLTYQYVYKYAGFQNIFTVGPTFYTNANLVNQGYVADMYVGQTSTYAFGSSHFSLGASVGLSGNTFDKNGGFDSYGHSILADQTSYEISAYPFAEYQLTSRLNLRTLFGFQYEHTRAMANTTTFMKDKVYESFGLGISVTRDVFLYPNIQFIPDELRASETNVGISSYINIF